ncbi:MAG: hypothetical protein P8166_00260, partial [Candidatus Thiodiazotropha sp.]
MFTEWIPGLNSYRGRYAYLSLIACLILLGIAYLSWHQFSHTTESQISVISQRSQTSSLLVDVQSRLDLLANYLQRIVIEPHAEDIDAATRTYNELDARLQALVELPGFADAEMRKGLLSGNQRLGGEVERLLQVRQDVDRWFPAMRLLREEMYPTSMQMLGELQLLKQEAEAEIPLAQKLALVEASANLRRTWLGMVEEMHHFIAYRFGVFPGDERDSGQDYSVNLDYLAARVSERLDALRQIYTEERFGLDADGRMERLETHYLRWLSAAKQVFLVMDNKAWRHDLQLMREEIRPILSNIHERLSQIDLQLDRDSALDIKQLTMTARSLSESILGIALIGMLMLLLAYLYINRYLLKPIAQTAFALKEEARGAMEVRPPSAHLREILDLVEAFSDMRRQVHQRQRYLD